MLLVIYYLWIIPIVLPEYEAPVWWFSCRCHMPATTAVLAEDELCYRPLQSQSGPGYWPLNKRCQQGYGTAMADANREPTRAISQRASTAMCQEGQK